MGDTARRRLLGLLTAYCVLSRSASANTRDNVQRSPPRAGRSADRGAGKYDIAYDDGDEETGVQARLIRRLPRSPLDIARENGHVAVVALLEEHQK